MRIIRIFPLFIFALVTVFYFHKMFIGLVPIPLDILVGSYFPWLDYKWGFIVGVPVKNPSLTDVFSQLYPWRSLAVDMIRQGQLPLWNPYSFSGTPLLANWQSAPLYPLNILMLVFGNLWGWSFMIALQPFLSMVFMHLFLRELKLKILPSTAGAIVFAFSGFMVTYLEYGTGGQILLWLPLMLFSIERYLRLKNPLYLILLPILCFFMLTAGFFQPAFYAIGFAYCYFVFRILEQSTFKLSAGFLISFLKVNFIFLLGFCLSAIQLVPTFELFLHSFRDLDHNIIEYAYGLLPLINITTFLAPDFYGNPATNNFWGFMGYQETSGYMGIVPLVFIILAIIKFQTQKKIFLLFGVLFVFTLLLALNTPVGRLIYLLKIPMLSSGYGARILFLTTFLGSVLAAFGFNYWLSEDYKSQFLVKKISFWILVFLTGIILGLVININWLSSLLVPDNTIIVNLKIALKNSLLPLMVLALLFIGFKYMPKKLLVLPVFLLLVFDLLRFAFKFNTFSPVNQNYPKTPVTDFIKSGIGSYRIEKEKAEIFPSNTWTPFKLMSPSGYDPLYSKQYASFYNVYNGNPPGSYFTRYAELDKYDLPFLDLAGVKYLATIDRGKFPYFDPDFKSINQDQVLKEEDYKFKKAFKEGSVIVLENTKVLPRVNLYDRFDIEEDYLRALERLHQGYNFNDRVMVSGEPGKILSKNSLDKAEIINYLANEVTIKTQTAGNSILMLTDSYYPGWEVSINGQKAQLLTADGIFKAVVVPKGENIVKFSYQPASFKLGWMISLLSLLTVLSLGILELVKKRIR